MRNQRRASFGRHASVALVGLPGVGKSTLGVIAAGSMKMKLVETDRCFYTKTGFTAGDYLRAYGRDDLLVKEIEILQLILDRHTSDCIIAVATRTSDIPACRRLLEKFSQQHPVLHVVREPDYVVQYLEGHMSAEDVLAVYNSSLQRLRAIANFEFFLYESSDTRETSSRPSSKPTFLSLKDVERDFLGLLRFINGRDRRTTFLTGPEDTDFSRMLLIPFPFSQDETPIDFDEIQGVHAVQLRIDFQVVGEADWTTLLNRISRAFARVRANCLHPLALSVDNAFHPGSTSLRDERRYFGILDHAVSLGFEYCYVDLHAPRQGITRFMKNKGTTRIVGTWHHIGGLGSSEAGSWWQSPDCLSVYWAAVDLGCAILQMSSGPIKTMQHNFDAVSCVQALSNMNPATNMRLSIFNTGDIGRLSRVLNRVLSPVILPSAALTKSLQAPGDYELEGVMTLEEAQLATRCSLTVDKLRFCSFGAVISHSVGPAMHNAAFDVLGLPYRYGVMESENLKEALALMGTKGFGGLSVANPYKQAMIPFLDRVSGHVRAIKAVNTVYTSQSPTEDRQLTCGENTDWLGVVSTVRYSLSPINAVTAKTTALVIGAGGMARAAVYALLHLGLSSIFIINRTVKNADAIAADFSQASAGLAEPQNVPRVPVDEPQSCTFTILPMENSGLKYEHPITTPPTIIINTLPDGKEEPVSSTFDLPIAWFSRPTGGVYIETAYRVSRSILRRKVESLAPQNWIYIGGQELLVEQGLPQVELWTGMTGPRKVMRRVVGL